MHIKFLPPRSTIQWLKEAKAREIGNQDERVLSCWRIRSSGAAEPGEDWTSTSSESSCEGPINDSPRESLAFEEKIATLRWANGSFSGVPHRHQIRGCHPNQSWLRLSRGRREGHGDVRGPFVKPVNIHESDSAILLKDWALHIPVIVLDAAHDTKEDRVEMTPAM